MIRLAYGSAFLILVHKTFSKLCGSAKNILWKPDTHTRIRRLSCPETYILRTISRCISGQPVERNIYRCSLKIYTLTGNPWGKCESKALFLRDLNKNRIPFSCAWWGSICICFPPGGGGGGQEHPHFTEEETGAWHGPHPRFLVSLQIVSSWWIFTRYLFWVKQWIRG